MSTAEDYGLPWGVEPAPESEAVAPVTTDPAPPAYVERIADAKAHLDALYHGAPPAAIGVVSWYPTGDDGWRSRCFRVSDAAQAAEFAVRCADTLNEVYIRTGLLAEPVDAYHRGTTKQTRLWPGWSPDLDYFGPGHVETNLPPDAASALAIIEAMPVEATRIRSSGGGFYPDVLLQEPINMTDPGAIEVVRDIGRRLDLALRAGHEYHVDRTAHDLTRVTRLPGTIRRKGDEPPLPVRTIRDDGPRYTVALLDSLLPEAPPVITPPRRAVGSGSGAAARFDELWKLEQVLAADVWDWEQVRGADGWDCWRRVGSTAAYSVKQSPDTGRIIVWSATVAERLGVESPADFTLYWFACLLQGTSK
jgi:hypothetical protein